MLETRDPIPTLDFSAFFAESLELLSSDFVTGVFEETRFDGRQYSFFPPAPQALPLLVSTHFSAPQRFKSDPAFVFLTFPDAFLHLAIACDALADWMTFYCCHLYTSKAAGESQSVLTGFV